MLQSWWNLALLATESQHVVCLRLIKLGSGGFEAQEEACLMVSEKVEAGIQTGLAVMMGGSPDRIVSTYRSRVQANVARLSKA
ncbi:hypothetical protein [Enterovirga rhinocerotis]|uniref:Uncharacterized protein n=1 Tax=Enterovirga rhinocerotis TaxID=1339210 RepID=A0A4R7C653_9HYPH|nr:hypothetical protein [Enterovirga rhinocerotis]TDR93711.1 hypothetical protein EV668_0976 [Enterovirga rhinocerotis]